MVLKRNIFLNLTLQGCCRRFSSPGIIHLFYLSVPTQILSVKLGGRWDDFHSPAIHFTRASLLIAAAAMQGTASHYGSHLGSSVVSKDTAKTSHKLGLTASFPLIYIQIAWKHRNTYIYSLTTPTPHPTTHHPLPNDWLWHSSTTRKDFLFIRRNEAKMFFDTLFDCRKVKTEHQ